MSNQPQNQENPQLIALGHELNNIWTGLIGSAELLQMALPEHAPEQEYAQMLLDGIERGEQITQKIRAIAHGETFDSEPQPSANSPEATMADIALDTSTISTANPSIDHEHRTLEKTIADLSQAQSAEEALPIASLLYTLSLRHFYHEEQLIRRCPNYPFFEHHHDTHCALACQLRQLQANLHHSYDRSAILAITEALPLHIFGMDAGMKPYICAQPDLAQWNDCSLPEDAVLAAYFQCQDSNGKFIT